jgi:transcriptional regulator
MYLPKSFAETDARVLHEFIGAHPLATLVSLDEEGLSADHIPMLLVRDDEGRESLQGHVARANPLWRNLARHHHVLAVFQDPGLYITPSWYASKAQTQKVVPTWNYIAVHAYGTARAVEDPAWLRDFLVRLVTVHEKDRPEPWRLTDAPEDYLTVQMKAIVGIEIAVTRWLGKWKASQNRLPQDIDGVIAGLRELATPAANQMADAASAKRS